MCQLAPNRLGHHYVFPARRNPPLRPTTPMWMKMVTPRPLDRQTATSTTTSSATPVMTRTRPTRGVQSWVGGLMVAWPLRNHPLLVARRAGTTHLPRWCRCTCAECCAAFNKLVEGATQRRGPRPNHPEDVGAVEEVKEGDERNSYIIIILPEHVFSYISSWCLRVAPVF